jgi:hypothetical protein
MSIRNLSQHRGVPFLHHFYLLPIALCPNPKGTREREMVASSKAPLEVWGQEGLTERDVARNQKHKVFEDSFDAKQIYHRTFLLQEINYINLSCIRGRWKLVEHWEFR